MMLLLKVCQLHFFHLLPIHALSMRSFGNSTSLPSLITTANVTSSLTTTSSGFKDCEASYNIWDNAMISFHRSVSSERVAGRYSSTISMIEYTQTIVDYSEVRDTPKDTLVDYSYVRYTPKDGSMPPPSTSFPTATRITKWTNTETSFFEPTFTGKAPECDLNPECYCSPNSCTISAPNVQLIYWPVSTVSGYPNLIVTLNATEPVTAIVNGSTFTSPTIYLSYDGVVAIDRCSRTIGKAYSGAVLSMNPTAVSSIELPHGPTSQFNFADLNTPYPPDVLLQMCWPEPPEFCEVGTNDTYQPKLVVPDEIRNLDPAWKSCDPDWLAGSWDPPRRLVPANALAQPTSSADIKPTSPIPTPARTVRSQGAASTAKLDAEVISSTALTSPTQSHTGNDMLAASFPFESSSAIILPNQSPPAMDSSDQKLSATNTPANNSPTQNQPTKTEPIKSSPFRDPPTINPSRHYSPAQNTPATNLPNNKPSANDPAPNSLPASDPTTKASPINEPSAKNLPGNAASIKNPLTNEIPARPSSVQSSPLDDPTVVLPPITVKSQVFTANSASHDAINSQTLVPGGEITVSGTPVSVPPLHLSAKVSPPSMPIIVIESQSVKATPISQHIIDSQTLKRSGQIIVSGTSRSAPALPAAISISDPTLPPLSIASKIYSANSASQYIIASQTLTPNGKIFLSGTPISLLPSASAIVIGSLTNNLLPTFTSPTALPPKVLEILLGSTTEALFPSVGLPPLTIASQTRERPLKEEGRVLGVRPQRALSFT